MTVLRSLLALVFLGIPGSCNAVGGSVFGDSTELPQDGTAAVSGRLITKGDIALTPCCVNIYPFDEADEWETDEFRIERRLSVGVELRPGNAYSFRHLRAGRYRLELTWDLYPTTSDQFASGMLVDRTRGRSIQLGAVTLLEGKEIQHDVELGDQSPGLLDVAVRIDGRSTSRGMVAILEPEFVESLGRDGVAHFGPVPPGDYALAAGGDAPGGQRLSMRAVVRPGETTQLTCELHAATHKLRCVRADTHVPVPGLPLTMIGRDVPRSFFIRGLATDGDGFLTLTTYPGQLELYTDDKHAAPVGGPVVYEAPVIATMPWSDSGRDGIIEVPVRVN